MGKRAPAKKAPAKKKGKDLAATSGKTAGKSSKAVKTVRRRASTKQSDAEVLSCCGAKRVMLLAKHRDNFNSIIDRFQHLAEAQEKGLLDESIGGHFEIGAPDDTPEDEEKMAEMLELMHSAINPERARGLSSTSDGNLADDRLERATAVALSICPSKKSCAKGCIDDCFKVPQDHADALRRYASGAVKRMRNAGEVDFEELASTVMSADANRRKETAGAKGKQPLTAQENATNSITTSRGSVGKSVKGKRKSNMSAKDLEIWLEYRSRLRSATAKDDSDVRKVQDWLDALS